MRQGCGPSESGPQFAPHFNTCAGVGFTGEIPDTAMATNTATLIATSAVVTGGLLRAVTARGGGAADKLPGASIAPRRHSAQTWLPSPNVNAGNGRPQLM